MNIHTQLCTVAHRSMWYFHELKIALLPSYNTVKENLKNKYKSKNENNTGRYILKLFFFFKVIKKLNQYLKKKKRLNLILNDFNDN